MTVGEKRSQEHMSREMCWEVNHEKSGREKKNGKERRIEVREGENTHTHTHTVHVIGATFHNLNIEHDVHVLFSRQYIKNK